MRITAVFAVMLLASAGTAQAALVPYTVTSVASADYSGPFPPPAGAPHLLDGEGYPGDTVELSTYSGMIDLTPGTTIQKVNTLVWNVSYTYNGTNGTLADDSPAGGDWPDLTFTVDAERTMSIDGGAAQALTQDGTLKTTWDDDYLSMNDGGTTTFIVGIYQVEVTPLGLPVANVNNIDGYPLGTPWHQSDRDVTAQFVITEIPGPTPLALIGLGGLLKARRRRR